MFLFTASFSEHVTLVQCEVIKDLDQYAQRLQTQCLRIHFSNYELKI